MSKSCLLALAAFAAVLCVASGQYQYQTKMYTPPMLTGATTCVKGVAGNTPILCPLSAGVPLTDDGKSGSTACVTGVDGKTYEGVLSLMYPAQNAVPWCTTNSQCGTDGTGNNPRVICAAQGPVGSGNTCFPLAVSTCPFTGDTVNSTTTASTGRKLMMMV